MTLNIENCPICLEPLVFEVAEINQEPNPCRHKFCKSCFLNLLKTFQDDPHLDGTMVCPLCRRVYVGESFSDFCYLHPVYNWMTDRNRSVEPETVINPLFQDLTEWDVNESSDSSLDLSDESLYVPSDSSEEVADDPYEVIDLTGDSE